MITPSFSTTATERVLPKLALDFTTASLDSRITFSRSLDTATRINSSGFIESVAANTPRFDYTLNTGGSCKGLLIEEQRTNLLLHSSNFSDAVWTKSDVTVANNATTAPDGTVTACSFTATSSDCAVVQQASVTNGTTYVFSVYLKADATTSIDLYINTNGAGSYVNLPITITTQWTRFEFPFTATGTSCYVLIGGGGSFSSPEVFYSWGAQLEAGAFATSYIPTTTTALTRNADVATMTGTNFSSWWTATTGATNVSAVPKATTGTNPLFQIDDNTADNVISLRGNAANPELYIKATTDQAQIDAGTIVANTAYKLAGAWNTNSCAAAQNGAAAVTDTSATIPTVTQTRIGSDGTNYANAWLQKINYWPQRITNNEVQAFSK